jgi:hypothetical protein
MIFPVCFTISWSISPSWLNSNFVASVPNVLRFQTLVLLVILRWCFPRKFQWRMDSRGFSLPGWVIHEVITFKDIHGEARQLRRELIRKTRDQPTWSIFLGDCLHICVCLLSTVKPPSMSKVLTRPISIIFATGNHVFHHYLSCL